MPPVIRGRVPLTVEPALPAMWAPILNPMTWNWLRSAPCSTRKLMKTPVNTPTMTELIADRG